MRLGFHQDASLEANRVCTGPGVGCVFAGQGVSASEKIIPDPKKSPQRNRPRPRKIAVIPDLPRKSQDLL